LRLSGQRIRRHNPGPLEGEKPREAQYPDVSLAAARKKRDDAREKLAAGMDPGEAKRSEKRAVRLAAANSF
ncbi:integrase arm-type DNA-binding domain-containing protein, partial [Burkholderia multivorans]|uniref:integrase arm-type DNA-binding domain-containing protein n=1 Tax=Burkholderia multivorans TaxID=87883 RepID=UPI0015E2C22D